MTAQPADTTPIRIVSGEWEATIRPAVGGALATLSKDGRQMLRPMPDIATDVLDAACFPLVPFCNRIADARFDWEGKTIALTPDLLAYPHALHGTGWRAIWSVEQAASDSVDLRLDHGEGEQGWPWAFTARLRYSVSEQGLAIAISVTNRSARDMPAGLGLHPYFRRSSQTTVRFGADTVMLTGADDLPSGLTAKADRFAPWSTGAELPPGLVDHCHTGWSGTAEIADHFGTVVMQADGAPHLHLYAPPGSGILCCEPVTHRPDALNQFPRDMTVLEPAKTKQINLQISHR